MSFDITCNASSHKYLSANCKNNSLPQAHVAAPHNTEHILLNSIDQPWCMAMNANKQNLLHQSALEHNPADINLTKLSDYLFWNHSNSICPNFFHSLQMQLPHSQITKTNTKCHPVPACLRKSVASELQTNTNTLSHSPFSKCRRCIAAAQPVKQPHQQHL